MTNKIGLLGGSFNPPHAGHVHISLEAIKALGLDEVWWLVSPQNPLKPTIGMAAFEERFSAAKELTKATPAIKISDFEITIGTSYTFDTITALQKQYPANNFVWLMGADNLVNFHQWHNWREIFSLLPIAVLDRAEYATAALASEAAIAFKNSCLLPDDFKKLPTKTPPAWCFINIEKHPASSTEIRNIL
jgi:nicotinate-nucleotide adenylyltransferase